MNILVGHSGLVGETLKEKTFFNFLFNSKNIDTFNDIIIDDYNNLWLCCLPASKWIVNKNTIRDVENINNIIRILCKKKYNNVFLFSTIDIYNSSPQKVNEDYFPNINELNYGTNRYFFELLISKCLIYNDLKIFRLPAVFNKKIKKNILFDLINNNNISKIKSNSFYQWYNLDNIYNDVISYTSKYPNEKIFNLFTEPIDTNDILKFFPHHVNHVERNQVPIVYNYTTKYEESGYISDKSIILEEIKKLVDELSIK